MIKIVITVITIFLMLAFAPYKKMDPINKDTSLAEIQEQLGIDFGSKKPNMKIKGVSARVGEDLVKKGFSKIDGQKKAKRQSKHFVCTSCHNVKREDPNLAFVTPEARLKYVSDRGLPFMQATTLYGAVNRETYYNGDYEKKYGDLVKDARDDVRGAIQLCALECAQGRKLKDWELESILAYMWTIDLKLNDLELTEFELEAVEAAVEKGEAPKETLALLSSKYQKKSHATFMPPPPDRKAGVGLPGNPTNGQLIYKNSCLHCHYQKRYSFLHLDEQKMSINHLDSKADTYNRHSLYQVVRYGTYSKYGKRSYMPRYSKERMSDQQLADLRAYIATEAKEL